MTIIEVQLFSFYYFFFLIMMSISLIYYLRACASALKLLIMSNKSEFVKILEKSEILRK